MYRDEGLSLLSVEEAAKKFGVSARTIRRWCESGRLTGQLVGMVWVIWEVPDTHPEKHGRNKRYPAIQSRHPTREIRQRLRAAGQKLIDTGNVIAGAHRRPGKLFLTWQSQRSLRVTFAIGRLSPLRGWAPLALESLPFWMEERQQWREVIPLLKRYEMLRAWCSSKLLRIPGVGALVLEEIIKFEVAVAAIQGDRSDST